MFRRQALLVKSVARLVQDGEKSRVEKLLVVARGDAAIVRTKTGGKRMGRHIEPAAIEIVTDRLGGLLGEAFLRFDRKITLENVASAESGR